MVDEPQPKLNHPKQALVLSTLLVSSILAVAAYLAELARLVREDRPVHPPRSHSDEIDPGSRPFAQL